MPFGASGNEASAADQLRSEFLNAYDAVLATWPPAVESIDVTTEFGTTRANICGPDGGTPLVLLPGGGATSTVWFANVEALSQSHRVYAIDLINDVGRTAPDGQNIRGRDDLMRWLDAVLAKLHLPNVRLCGHSYAGWLALNYAMHAPGRVSELALLDPTDCFTGLSLSYRLHAVPVLVRPNRQRMRSLLTWETDGRRLDQAWLELITVGSELPRPKLVMPRRPTAKQLRAMTVPTLVLAAEKSKAHDIERLVSNARRHLPDVTTVVLEGACHHSIPTEDPHQLNKQLTQFFARASRGDAQ